MSLMSPIRPMSPTRKNRKLHLLISVAWAAFWVASLPFAARANAAVAGRSAFRIVIDAGHGGSDHGTVHDAGMVQIAEKDVTLLLARGVARELKARGYDVTLTRNEDREIPLGARTQIANRLGADLFLSIHMNAGEGAEGIETYILNNATDASSRRLAHLENTVISRDGIDTPEKADVALILRDLRLDANLSESKRLACEIQSSLLSATQHLVPPPGPGTRLATFHKAKRPSSLRRTTRDRGVKQALFHVLLGADMPSVLLEAGFLSSPRDRALVLSPQGRHAMSSAIAGAVEQFRLAKGTPRATAALSRCKVH